MLAKQLADKLTVIAIQQLEQGLRAKQKRMSLISEMIDVYNNKTIETDGDIMNIPFPFFASHIDLLFSKIDNAPSCTFKIPNKKILSEKVQAAFEQEKSSTRSGWSRKDRAEKKQELLSGRAISKIYASSEGNNYKSHYDLVDVFSFVADPTRGTLEEGNYHGETDIYKTHDSLVLGAKNGFYDKSQVERLKNFKESQADGNSYVVTNKFNRMKALGIDVDSSSFVEQKGVNMTEWVMKDNGTWFYLLFDPKSKIWVRVEELKEVFKSGKTPFVSWASHYDEFSFWTKGESDDVYPITEAMKFLLNTALENEKRRTRPMRAVESGSLVDINELQDFVPDNVLLFHPGRNPNIVTIENPAASLTIDLVSYLDNLNQSKSGVSEPGTQEADAKVGVFYGKLQQEADRIGIINKEYSESYAHKGYRFFWGMKEHLTKPKMVELLGKGGIKLQQLESVDFKDVDDVDDVIVSGGSSEQQTSAIENEKQLSSIKELTGSYPDKINARWVIRNVLLKSGFNDDDVSQALDTESSLNQELMEEADNAIQDILLDKMPRLNMGADITFLQRILDYAKDNLDYVLLDDEGNEKGIDKDMKKQFDMLLKYARAHENIVVGNMMRKSRKLAAGQVPQGEIAQNAVDVGGQATGQQMKQSLARPFESPTGTPEGTAEASQVMSKRMR